MPAVLNSTSPTRNDHYPYSENGMGSISNNNMGGYRQSATTNRSPTSMYNTMSQICEKEARLLQDQKIIEETTTITKSKKVSPRPLTPHNNRKNNVNEKNKQASVPKSTTVKKSKEDSKSISPPPSLKPKSRPLTPGTNGQSSSKVVDKKKNDGASSTKVTSPRRTASPPVPTTRSAHSRSHAHVRPESPPAKPAHTRSHARVTSPENQNSTQSARSSNNVRPTSPELASLRDEVKKYKRLYMEREEWLREKDSELLEAEDLLESFQERVREVEARNRELQKENEIMRNYIEEEREKKKTSINEPTKIISSMSSNIQRIRGESSPNNSKPNSPTFKPSSSPIPIVSPPSSPVSTILKSKELSKANSNASSPPLGPRVVPPTRGNLIPANKVNNDNNNSQNDIHPPRPTAPSPAAMNRQKPYNGGGFEMLNKQAEMPLDRKSASDRKKAAALNVVMEESEDSDTADEFIFATTDDDFNYNHDTDDNDQSDQSDQSEYEDDDNDDDLDNWSTHASSKLDNIIEEDDEEEENYDGFKQQNDSPVITSVAPQVSPINNNKNRLRNRQLDSLGSSDSGIGSSGSSPEDENVPFTQKNKDYSTDYCNRNSVSSIKSNSSEDSVISNSSSQNNSYPSSATSPSSFGISDCGSFTKSINSINNNLQDSSLFGQSSSSKSNNSKSSTDYDFNDSSKQSNPARSTSPLSRALSPGSSSRASTPSSYASTFRAPSPSSSTSSRSPTPASESSRNASSGYNRRSGLSSSSDKSSTAIPPPPPPPTTKDPFATLQHYLKLISETSVMENPLKSYDIKKVIDEGSSAKVYTAHPLSNPSEECAIKVVPLSYSLEFIFNEIYVLKNLKHKNIVDFKESFLRWDGKTREVWIAMEKCARGDVTSRAGKVSQREVGRIAGDLLNALKHLHDNGVIHRDIKLSNILANANNEIKLADFGIASLTPTSTTSMVGTIPYMAPDVVLVGPDRPYDTKVDIWSVGVCILELLTGKAAWGRIRDDEIMNKLRRGDMPYGFQRLQKKADIGWEAKDFLEKCFARTPENRWSAERLLEHPFITGNRV